MCARSPVGKRRRAQTSEVVGSTPTVRMLRAGSPAGKRCLAQTQDVVGSTPTLRIFGGMAELVMRPAATRYTVTRAGVRVPLPPPWKVALNGRQPVSKTGPG